MACSVIDAAGRFALIFQSSDCKKLQIQDISDWFLDEGHTKPDSYTIDLYLPHSMNPIQLTIKTNGMNTFTMVDLGYGNSDLMEGIYCIKAKIADREFRIHKVLLCKTRCCYDQYIAHTRLEELKANLLKIELVDQLINDIPKIVESGEIEKAEDYIRMLHTELKFLNCNCR